MQIALGVRGSGCDTRSLHAPLASVTFHALTRVCSAQTDIQISQHACGREERRLLHNELYRYRAVVGRVRLIGHRVDAGAVVICAGRRRRGQVDGLVAWCRPPRAHRSSRCLTSESALAIVESIDRYQRRVVVADPLSPALVTVADRVNAAPVPTVASSSSTDGVPSCRFGAVAVTVTAAEQLSVVSDSSVTQSRRRRRSSRCRQSTAQSDRWTDALVPAVASDADVRRCPPPCRRSMIVESVDRYQRSVVPGDSPYRPRWSPWPTA